MTTWVYSCYNKNTNTYNDKVRTLKKGIMLEAYREIYVENLLLQIKQFSKAREK